MCSANEQMSIFRILQETLSPSKRDNIIFLTSDLVFDQRRSSILHQHFYHRNITSFGGNV